MSTSPWRRAAGAVAAMLALAACAPDPPAAVVGVRAQGCGPVPADGTGVFVDHGLVLTAAHTVAGSTTVEIVRDGTSRPAELAALDPTHDLALLRVDDRLTAPLPTAAARPGRNTPATAYVVRGGEWRRIDVTIVRPVVIDTTDIYLEGTTERPGFELAADIVPGDSGAPVVVDGYLVGVVWARSSTAGGRAYAIEATALRVDASADLTRCAG
ncbi:MAG TPA: serine protease [Ilumatobacter sp.]|nr:serine protease [Ilumatobacter sp.]